jgi:hypothetical protein
MSDDETFDQRSRRIARAAGRKTPIRVMQSGLTDTWYLVTRYRIKDSPTGGYLIADQRQEMLPEDLEALRRWFVSVPA